MVSSAFVVLRYDLTVCWKPLCQLVNIRLLLIFSLCEDAVRRFLLFFARLMMSNITQNGLSVDHCCFVS